MMERVTMRRAIAMIELIFAIVVIAISVISIPSMIAVADKATKGVVIDEDVMSRLMGWTLDKSQGRWDEKYQASGSGPLLIAGSGDLECAREGGGGVWYRVNPDSTVQCDDQNRSPSTMLSLYPDGNISLGIERLNGGTETITITATSGEEYEVTATYAVGYVNSALTNISGNTVTATWRLGSSNTMNPAPSGTSHLKRVVTRFYNDDLGVDTTLTFFKSNKGN